ncbi:unnamed protein product [Ambrosiozyma monospora]|uniref:Unnamed protein product n=1 Tax=Ambrosiozyma monospora TaxID=43982 RepID=A0ACB5TQL9_AMBMO|nr:unnamed protein product [Ambrosiozyma monospora]
MLATGGNIPFTAEKYKNSTEGKCELKENDTTPTKQFADDEGHNSTGLTGQLTQMKKLNPKLKVMLSIGGSDSNKDFTKLTKTKPNTKKFVTNALSFMKKYGFDGIDIDWEYPNDQESKDKLTSLVNEFDTQLSIKNSLSEGSKYLLSIAVPSSQSQLANFDLASIHSKIAKFNLMGYDQKGSWSSSSGYQSNLFQDSNDPDGGDSVNGTVHYMLGESVPANKIVLGMPAYGHSFNTNKLYSQFHGCASIDGVQQDNESCTINYKDLPPKGYKDYYDEDRGSAYAISPDADEKIGQAKEEKRDDINNGNGGEVGKTGTGVIVYDNEKSARAKAQYVKKMGLGGGMWWDSEGDSANCNRSLLMQFVDELGGVEKLGDVTVKDGDDKTNNNNSKSGACGAFKTHALVVIFGNVLLAVLL